MTGISSLAIAAAVAGLAGPAYGQFGVPRPGTREASGNALVTVQVVPSAHTVAAGEPFEFAIAFRIEPQWHIYWRNAGASGMPTEVRVIAPEGFEVGALRWPTPRSFTGEEGITYGYERNVALFVPITAPAELPAGPIEFTLAIDWLVCRGVCLTGSARRTLVLNDETNVATVPAVFERIAQTSRGSIPQPIRELDDSTVRIDGSTLVVEGPVAPSMTAPADAAVHYYPIESPGVTTGRARVETVGGRFSLRVPLEIRPENSLGEALTVGGVVALPDGNAYEFVLEVDSTEARP